jgi:hypothetical protein
MHWKVLLAAMLIIAICGLLLITPIGQKYTEGIRGTLTKSVGSLTAVILRQKPSSPFTIDMSASKESFYGQSFKLDNASVSIKGNYQSISVGGQSISLKSNKEINVNIQDASGTFEMLSNGDVRASANSYYLEIDDYVFSSGKTMKVDIEVAPSTFSVFPLVADKITFSSVTGEVKRLGETNINTAELSGSKLEIKGFSGYLKMETTGKITLNGLSSSVKGDTFNFV